MQITNTKAGDIPQSHHQDGILTPESCSTISSATPPSQVSHQKGQSVDIAPQSWFVIRATRGRAQKVYEALTTQLPSCENLQSCELYLPMVLVRQVNKAEREDSDITIIRRPLDNGLLFVRCSMDQFRELLQLPVAGLTPYYDHTRQTEFGRNPYLIVPDNQFNSFRTIIDSDQDGIITDQTGLPLLFKGDRVRVTDGPFTGVEGHVLKYKHQLRVFVQVNCLGTYATAYVPRAFLEKIE